MIVKKFKDILKGATLIICLIFFCQSLIAQTINYNQEFQVNTHTNANQKSSAVSGLSDGGFVVCWMSDYQDGSLSGIFGQRFSGDGMKLGQEFQINTYINSQQLQPTVGGLSDGGFVVCWESVDRDGSSQGGIFGQLYDNDGSQQSKRDGHRA